MYTPLQLPQFKCTFYSYFLLVAAMSTEADGFGEDIQGRLNETGKSLTLHYLKMFQKKNK